MDRYQEAFGSVTQVQQRTVVVNGVPQQRTIVKMVTKPYVRPFNASTQRQVDNVVGQALRSAQENPAWKQAFAAELNRPEARQAREALMTSEYYAKDRSQRKALQQFREELGYGINELTNQTDLLNRRGALQDEGKRVGLFSAIGAANDAVTRANEQTNERLVDVQARDRADRTMSAQAAALAASIPQRAPLQELTAEDLEKADQALAAADRINLIPQQRGVPSGEFARVQAAKAEVRTAVKQGEKDVARDAKDATAAQDAKEAEQTVETAAQALALATAAAAGVEAMEVGLEVVAKTVEVGAGLALALPPPPLPSGP